jgi:DNA-binding transcriptional ArsR family regulator
MKSDYCPNLKVMPLSNLFAALADPVRLEILRSLLREDEVSCGQCKAPKAKSTMSHHFRVLREAGLVQRREEGTIHYMSVRRAEIEARLPGLLEALLRAKAPL